MKKSITTKKLEANFRALRLDCVLIHRAMLDICNPEYTIKARQDEFVDEQFKIYENKIVPKLRELAHYPKYLVENCFEGWESIEDLKRLFSTVLEIEKNSTEVKPFLTRNIY